MVIFSVLYPATPGAQFDQAYYDATHIPLVKEAFTPTGLKDVQVFVGVSAADGGPAPFVAMAHLVFEDVAAMQASRGGPRGAEVAAELANFTTIKPITQVSTLD